MKRLCSYRRQGIRRALFEANPIRLRRLCSPRNERPSGKRCKRNVIQRRKGKDCIVIEIRDVTDEYKSNARPQIGILAFEDGYEQSSHTDEIETARWLHMIFGGNLTLLKESTRQGVKTADYLWNDRLWERKGVSSSNFNTINRRVRKAYMQIAGDNGGIILDFTDSKLTMEQAIKIVLQSVERRSRGFADIIIKKKNVFKVFRAKK